MYNFSNEYIKKAFKKKLLLVIIGVIFVAITIMLGIIRENAVDKKLSKSMDMHNTILSSDNEEKSSYVTINYYPYAFAYYNDESSNAYYIVADEKYFYIAYMNQKKVEKLTEEDITKGYKLKGVTKSVPYDIKELCIEAFNEWYEDEEDFEPISIADFNNYFGSIYLDTTKTKYGLTTGFNALFYFSIFITTITFIPGVYSTVSYRRRLRKLTTEEAMTIDSELNSDIAKYYNKANIVLTNKYLIDFGKFNYYDYKDIKWVYTHIQRTNGIKSSEHLVIVTKDGKRRLIAATSGTKKMKPMYEEIYNTLISKNPDIRVGYTSDNIKLDIEENKKIKQDKKSKK